MCMLFGRQAKADSYLLPWTITDWNFPPEHITKITEPEAFRLLLQHHLASPRAKTKSN